MCNSCTTELTVDEISRDGRREWVCCKGNSSDCLLSLQDLKSKRNPRLVLYVLLDERTKKSNRDSLREAIRTLIGYGYNIEPSDQEGGQFHSCMYAYKNTQTFKYIEVDKMLVR